MSKSDRLRRRAERRDAVRAAQADAANSKVAAAARFEVRCACGSVLRGERVEGETSIVCSACSSELAIDGTAGREAPLAAAANSELASARESVARAPRGAGTGATSAVPTIEANLHPDRLEQRRRVSWLRGLAVLVLLLVISTAYWGWQQRRRQQLALELTTTTNAGIAALDAGNYEQAVEQLARADRAARVLDSEDEPSRLARQLYGESLIWSKLAVSGLDEFFLSRLDALGGADAARCVREFDRELAGRSIVVQTQVRDLVEVEPQQPEGKKSAVAPSSEPDSERADSEREPSPAAADAPPLVVPVLDWQIVGTQLRVEIAPSDLRALATFSHEPEQEMILGAVLRSLERDPQRPGRWFVRLEPASCVLLTVPSPFAALNWPDRERLDPLLAEQRRRVLERNKAANNASEPAEKSREIAQ